VYSLVQPAVAVLHKGQLFSMKDSITVGSSSRLAHYHRTGAKDSILGNQDQASVLWIRQFTGRWEARLEIASKYGRR
jgi:hypothetical protein